MAVSVLNLRRTRRLLEHAASANKAMKARMARHYTPALPEQRTHDIPNLFIRDGSCLVTYGGGQPRMTDPGAGVSGR